MFSFKILRKTFITNTYKYLKYVKLLRLNWTLTFRFSQAKSKLEIFKEDAILQISTNFQIKLFGTNNGCLISLGTGLLASTFPKLFFSQPRSKVPAKYLYQPKVPWINQYWHQYTLYWHWALTQGDCYFRVRLKNLFGFWKFREYQVAKGLRWYMVCGRYLPIEFFPIRINGVILIHNSRDWNR